MEKWRCKLEGSRPATINESIGYSYKRDCWHRIWYRVRVTIANPPCIMLYFYTFCRAYCRALGKTARLSCICLICPFVSHADCGRPMCVSSVMNFICTLMGLASFESHNEFSRNIRMVHWHCPPFRAPCMQIGLKLKRTLFPQDLYWEF